MNNQDSSENKIQIRNIWLLLLYASDLFKYSSIFKNISMGEKLDDIPNLVAKILIDSVKKRLRSNLSCKFHMREAILNRVRGKVDIIYTECHQLLQQGKVACKFEELTVNTQFNQYVLYALERISRNSYVNNQNRKDIIYLINTLKQLGVTDNITYNINNICHQTGYQNYEDSMIITAAKLVLNMILPTELDGNNSFLSHQIDTKEFSKLFEKAIYGFYNVTLNKDDWEIKYQKILQWPILKATSKIKDTLPEMNLDIVLYNKKRHHNIIIDTKFKSILGKNQYNKEKLISSDIYQIYSYVQAQALNATNNFNSITGILLYPTINEMIDESFEIQGQQGQRFRFATVDLNSGINEFKSQLLRLCNHI